MQLYCNDKGQWSGTQSDAKKIKRENDGLSFESINVPTDKKGLLEFSSEVVVLKAHRLLMLKMM